MVIWLSLWHTFNHYRVIESHPYVENVAHIRPKPLQTQLFANGRRPSLIRTQSWHGIVEVHCKMIQNGFSWWLNQRLHVQNVTAVREGDSIAIHNGTVKPSSSEAGHSNSLLLFPAQFQSFPGTTSSEQAGFCIVSLKSLYHNCLPCVYACVRVCVRADVCLSIRGCTVCV